MFCFCPKCLGQVCRLLRDPCYQLHFGCDNEVKTWCAVNDIAYKTLTIGVSVLLVRDPIPFSHMLASHCRCCSWSCCQAERHSQCTCMHARVHAWQLPTRCVLHADQTYPISLFDSCSIWAPVLTNIQFTLSGLVRPYTAQICLSLKFECSV